MENLLNITKELIIKTQQVTFLNYFITFILLGLIFIISIYTQNLDTILQNKYEADTSKGKIVRVLSINKLFNLGLTGSIVASFMFLY